MIKAEKLRSGEVEKEWKMNIGIEKAGKNGLPYQTMINVFIHKFVTDAFVEKEEINNFCNYSAALCRLSRGSGGWVMRPSLASLPKASP
jgi:hypothetical protein